MRLERARRGARAALKTHRLATSQNRESQDTNELKTARSNMSDDLSVRLPEQVRTQLMSLLGVLSWLQKEAQTLHPSLVTSNELLINLYTSMSSWSTKC